MIKNETVKSNGKHSENIFRRSTTPTNTRLHSQHCNNDSIHNIVQYDHAHTMSPVNCIQNN